MNALATCETRSAAKADGLPLLPLISVLIPWIGRQKYIEATVAALGCQDYPNLEIVISDNSLSSVARTQLATIENARLRVVDRSEKRLCSADHFTACVREANGEYAMILSDDDLIESKYVSGMYEAICAHPDSTAVLGEQIVIGENDFPTPDDSGANLLKKYPGPRFFLNRLLNPRRLPIVTYVSVFARRRDLLMNPYKDYPEGVNSDNFMMLCLALGGDVTISSKKMYYRVYEKSGGLKLDFGRLVESCVQFERDVIFLVRQHRSTLGLGYRVMFPLLIRLRNTSMMARRLLGMYRRRMSIREFSLAAIRLCSYMVGLRTLPRTAGE